KEEEEEEKNQDAKNGKKSDEKSNEVKTSVEATEGSGKSAEDDHEKSDGNNISEVTLEENKQPKLNVG
ncbi:hypothetical protein PFISCL1PPCAC_14996, partial [Pristionchus fissidentatus]